MARPITLFTGQWTDLPLSTLAEKAAGWGYEGLEIACWGGHLDVEKAASDKEYCKRQRGCLEERGLSLWAISNHLTGQLVCDPNNDDRSDGLAPAALAGKAEAKRAWAVEAMKATACAAKNLGVKTVCGFTGSSIWHLIYGFPPVRRDAIDEGFAYFARMWNPILDVFEDCGVRFALEVHPTEIAFDLYTAERALEALGGRKGFGFNFDPSHLHWQMVDPPSFLRRFPDRIFHVHMKDASVQLDGRAGILCSHLDFGHPDRGWDFRSLGRGGIDFEEIVRVLNAIGYEGPLSVEWEDSGMDREHGAMEALQFVRRLDFVPSGRRFDSAFGK